MGKYKKTEPKEANFIDIVIQLSKPHTPEVTNRLIEMAMDELRG